MTTVTVVRPAASVAVDSVVGPPADENVAPDTVHFTVVPASGRPEPGKVSRPVSAVEVVNVASPPLTVSDTVGVAVESVAADSKARSALYARVSPGSMVTVGVDHHCSVDKIRMAAPSSLALNWPGFPPVTQPRAAASERAKPRATLPDVRIAAGAVVAV